MPSATQGGRARWQGATAFILLQQPKDSWNSGTGLLRLSRRRATKAMLPVEAKMFLLAGDLLAIIKGTPAGA